MFIRGVGGMEEDEGVDCFVSTKSLRTFCICLYSLIASASSISDDYIIIVNY